MKTKTQSTDIPDDWVVSQIDHSSEDPNFGFVETLYQTSAAALVFLWKSHFRSTTHGPQKTTLKKDVVSIQFWEENFPLGHLDTILAESSGLKIRVLENLIGIARILIWFFKDHDKELFSAQKKGGSKCNFASDLVTQVEKAGLVLDAEERSEEEDTDSDSDDSDDSSPTAKSHQNRFGRLHSYINCLVDLAPVVDRYIRSLKSKAEVQHVPIETVFQLSHNSQPYAMRIRDRFENAPTVLVERLAEANLERSIRLRRQEDEEVVNDPADQDNITLFKPFSLFHDSGIGTSVAPTVASHTSFLSVAGEEAAGRPRVPPLPQEGKHRSPFQCDYCHRTISMRNRIEWKMHIFADLQSYICTHKDCRDALKTFPTRQLWVDHEFSEHYSLTRWRCFPCAATLSTSELYVEHLAQAHSITLTGHRLAAMTSGAQETILRPEFKDHKCPLCLQDGWQSKKAYATHVGRHLEEISLACLPRDEEDSSEDDLDTEISSTPGDVADPTSSKGNLHEVDSESEAETMLLDPHSPTLKKKSIPADWPSEKHAQSISSTPHSHHAHSPSLTSAIMSMTGQAAAVGGTGNAFPEPRPISVDVGGPKINSPRDTPIVLFQGPSLSNENSGGSESVAPVSPQVSSPMTRFADTVLSDHGTSIASTGQTSAINRSLSDVYQDELYNPATLLPGSAISVDQQIRQTPREVISNGLQAPSQGHMSGHSPLQSSMMRERTPFRANSPSADSMTASTFNWQPLELAPRPILPIDKSIMNISNLTNTTDLNPKSPKDAILDFNETEDAASHTFPPMRLFPPAPLHETTYGPFEDSVWNPLLSNMPTSAVTTEPPLPLDGQSGPLPLALPPPYGSSLINNSGGGLSLNRETSSTLQPYALDTLEIPASPPLPYPFPLQTAFNFNEPPSIEFEFDQPGFQGQQQQPEIPGHIPDPALQFHSFEELAAGVPSYAPTPPLREYYGMGQRQEIPYYHPTLLHQRHEKPRR